MYKLILSLMVMALFVGCSSKEEKALLASYDKNIKYHKNLQKTEKGELLDRNTSVATIVATHMFTPNYDKNDTREEVFLIGVHFENEEYSRMNFDKNITFDSDRNISMASAHEYILTIKNKKASSVKKLDSNSLKLKEISFISDWGQYYEVKFPNSGSRFSLVFENVKYGKANLSFSKVAKFVYTKKGF